MVVTGSVSVFLVGFGLLVERLLGRRGGLGGGHSLDTESTEARGFVSP